jgi:hypothetical protein
MTTLVADMSSARFGRVAADLRAEPAHQTRTVTTVTMPKCSTPQPATTLKQLNLTMSTTGRDMKSSVRLKIVRSVDKEVAAKVNNIIRVTENLTEEFTASENRNYRNHDIVLDELSAALWHPAIAKFRVIRRRRLRGTEEHAERVRRTLFVETRDLQAQMSEFLKLAAILLLAEGRSHRPLPITP